MSKATLPQQIEGAKAYEALFVPALFRQWARKIADAAEIRDHKRVLDVASGTGILGREIASQVGFGGHVVGIDANPGMIEVAKALAPAIDWRQGMAEALPFADNSFDAVVSQFGLMFFNDRFAALREMLRVLCPGGLLAVAVWDSLDNIAGYAIEVSLVEQIAGQAAADELRAPFVLGDRKHLAKLFSDAGIPSIQITTHEGVAHFPSVKTMFEAELRGWLPLMGVILPEDQISRILAEAEQALCSFVSGGSVRFPISAHIVSHRRSSNAH